MKMMGLLIQWFFSFQSVVSEASGFFSEVFSDFPLRFGAASVVTSWA